MMHNREEARQILSLADDIVGVTAPNESAYGAHEVLELTIVVHVKWLYLPRRTL